MYMYVNCIQNYIRVCSIHMLVVVIVIFRIEVNMYKHILLHVVFYDKVM